MLKVKIITGSFDFRVEEEVNKFLASLDNEKYDVVDIKYSTSGKGHSSDTFHSVIVVYKTI